jgi:putative ABC transport system permease protein
VLVADGALMATGLVQPLSRVEYRYRVRDRRAPPAAWRAAFMAASRRWTPSAQLRRAQRPHGRGAGQIGSGLLLIGFSALFIGGLGVFNSVQAYLQGKLGSLATLRALGLRDAGWPPSSCCCRCCCWRCWPASRARCSAARWRWAARAGGRALPLAPAAEGAGRRWLVALLLRRADRAGLRAAGAGRALSVSPAALFRGIDGQALRTPGAGLVVHRAGRAPVPRWPLLVALLPDPRFGLAFVAAAALLLLLLEGVLRALRRRRSACWRMRAGCPSSCGWRWPACSGRARRCARAAVAGLGADAAGGLHAGGGHAAAHRQRHRARAGAGAGVLRRADRAARHCCARRCWPRRRACACRPRRWCWAGWWRSTASAARQRDGAARPRGARRAQAQPPQPATSTTWWSTAAPGGRPTTAARRWWRWKTARPTSSACRSATGCASRSWASRWRPSWRHLQPAALQSRLWLEAIFSDGVLDPFITRHVGAAWMPPADPGRAGPLAAVAPNIASVRTESCCAKPARLMGRASAGLAVVAGACLAASLLVLASVVAASRAASSTTPA